MRGGKEAVNGANLGFPLGHPGNCLVAETRVCRDNRTHEFERLEARAKASLEFPCPDSTRLCWNGRAWRASKNPVSARTSERSKKHVKEMPLHWSIVVNHSSVGTHTAGDVCR